MAVLAFAAAAEPDPAKWITGGGLIEPSEARVGRPATPVNAAGVARLSTRRVVRRTMVYIAVLPAVYRPRLAGEALSLKRSLIRDAAKARSLPFTSNAAPDTKVRYGLKAAERRGPFERLLQRTCPR
jgi:hypothetical protein